MDYSNIIFQTLISTVDGVGASTGKQTEVAFNENFALVKQLLEALFKIAAITVTSEQITQIKADTTTTPYTLYYTTDPLDQEEITWTKLVAVNFSDIEGNPLDNIALKTILDSKGGATEVATLTTQMSTAQTDIANLQTTVGEHTTTIGSHSASINSIQAELPDTVHTPHGDTLLLRFVTQTGKLEYSTDGTTWVDITTQNASFSSLQGNAYDNISLVNYVASELQLAIAELGNEFVSSDAFNSHILADDNPHNVTKAQLGLGNVDNYSAMDMPISNAAAAEFTTLRNRFPVFYFMQPSSYAALTTLELEDAIYVTSSSFPAEGGLGPNAGGNEEPEVSDPNHSG